MTNNNNWFVANDMGKVAGHDMTKAHAENLAAQMRDTPEFFYICFYGTSGDGYVSQDNTQTNDFDTAWKFDTEKDAESACAKLQGEWGSELKVTPFYDDSWEALSDDE